MLTVLDGPQTAQAVAGLSALEQLALMPGRQFTPLCRAERDRARPYGLDMARLLPIMDLDSLGRLGGAVVYARDFGTRNELLRDRFGDRTWYTARIEPRTDSLVVVLEPYRRR